MLCYLASNYTIDFFLSEPYLSANSPSVPVADLPAAGTCCLLVPPVRLSTVGNWTFTVAGSRVYTLPEDIDITTSQPLSAFCRHLRTWLFRKSYSDIISWTCLLRTFCY